MMILQSNWGTTSRRHNHVPHIGNNKRHNLRSLRMGKDRDLTAYQQSPNLLFFLYAGERSELGTIGRKSPTSEKIPLLGIDQITALGKASTPTMNMV